MTAFEERGVEQVNAAPETDPANSMYLLVDPAWNSSEDGAEPPMEAVVGSWVPDPGGGPSRFLPNLAYEPSQPGLPTDPVDAALQLVVRGESDFESLLERLPQVPLAVAIDDEDAVIVAPAPDDVPSVLVTTAPAHRERVDVDRWLDLSIAELAEALRGAGVDLLLNPGAPESMRIGADALARFIPGGAPESG